MTLTAIPDELNAGDQWEWTVTEGDYPASSSWVMTYVLINSSNKYTITSSADGDNHVVDFDASSVVAGEYYYQQYFELSGERKTLDSGYVNVLPDFAAETTYDNRSHVKIVLDAIESNLQGTASKKQQSMSVDGWSLSRYGLEELSNLREKYYRLWEDEKKKTAVANGENPGGRVQLKLGGG